jgi:hypothetical protein
MLEIRLFESHSLRQFPERHQTNQPFATQMAIEAFVSNYSGASRKGYLFCLRNILICRARNLTI